MQSIVLFGAGASKGSEVNNDVNTPPLGAELFNCLSHRYPKSWGILESEPFVTDFEVAMTNLVQSKPDYINQLQREMAMFLFEFQPTETSLYQRLIQELRIPLKAITHSGFKRSVIPI